MIPKLLAPLLLAAACATANAQSTDGALRTIEGLDVPRYLGTWYEVARFPNRFQRQCVADTSAHYTLREDGTLQVRNRCRLADGAMDEALGQARQIGGPQSPTLKVRFAPEWLSWLPFVWGDYWIVDLDADYSLVAITEPRRAYAWVLSRTPQVEPARYEALMQRLRAQGLDVALFERSAHTAP
ncbi:MAG: lipocalin family protein [Rubrivivax sp.]